MNTYFTKICFVIIGFMMVSSFVFAQDKTGPVTPQNKQLADEYIKAELINRYGSRSYELTNTRQYINDNEIYVVYTYTLDDAKILAKLKSEKITDKKSKDYDEVMGYENTLELLIKGDHNYYNALGLVYYPNDMYNNFRSVNYNSWEYFAEAKSFLNLCKKSLDSLGADPYYFVENLYYITEEDFEKYKNDFSFYSDVMRYIRSGERARDYYNKEYAEKIWQWNKWFKKDSYGNIEERKDYVAWYFANGKTGTEEDYNALKDFGNEPMPEDLKIYESEMEDYGKLLNVEKEIKEKINIHKKTEFSIFLLLQEYIGYYSDPCSESWLLNSPVFGQYINEYIEFAKIHVDDYEDLFRINTGIKKEIDGYDELSDEAKTEVWKKALFRSGNKYRINESAKIFEEENPFWPRYYKACEDFKYKKASNEERELWFGKLVNKDSIKVQLLIDCKIDSRRDSKGVIQKRVVDLASQVIILFDVYTEPGKSKTVMIPVYSFPKDLH